MLFLLLSSRSFPKIAFTSHIQEEPIVSFPHDMGLYAGGNFDS